MSRRTQIASFWLIQVLGNAALMAGAAWWLTWPDARSWQVVATSGFAAVLVLVALWLHGSTLAFFAGAESLGRAFGRGLRRLAPLLVWLIVLVALLLLLSWVKGRLPQTAVRAAQIADATPRQVTGAAMWAMFVVQWIVVPALLLPFAAEIAAIGFRGWRPGALRRWRHGLYWIGCAVFALGIYLPYRLAAWVLPVSSLTSEAVSVGVRFAIAYLLTITAWLFFAAILGRPTNLQKAGGPGKRQA